MGLSEWLRSNMRVVDVLTLIALVLGPVMAVGIQLWFEKRRESRKRKLFVLDTLMSYRGRLVHTDNVRAMNMIDVVFYDSPSVRTRFKTLLAHLDSDAMKAKPITAETLSRAEDLIVELISEIAKDVGYSFDHTAIKRQAYRPSAFNDEETYTAEVRVALMGLLQGREGIRVKVEQNAGDDGM
jgi:hypothetical protein